MCRRPSARRWPGLFHIRPGQHRERRRESLHVADPRIRSDDTSKNLEASRRGRV